MKIILDAGHGYNTPGKRTPDGVKEYEINRSIANYLKDILLGYYGVSVTLVHNDQQDVPLQARTDRANDLKGELYISIHSNASGDGKEWNSATGIETYVHPTASSQTLTLAKKIQRNLIVATGMKDRGVKTANFHVLREARMPSILVECGFMTNKDDAKLLKTPFYQKACAESIAKAIVAEYKLKKRAVASAPASPPKPKEPKTNGIYKVQAGSFQRKQNADELAAALKKQGFQACIVFESDKQ